MIDLTKEFNLDDAIASSLFSNKTQWWADGSYGSSLYTLTSNKLDNQLLTLAKQYTVENLGWLIADDIATSIDVDTRIYNISQLKIIINVYLSRTGAKFKKDFLIKWQQYPH